MPLPHSSGFDGIGFGRAGGHLVPVSIGQCQKRKLVFDTECNDHEMELEGQGIESQPWLGASSGPKRQCLWQSCGPLNLSSSVQAPPHPAAETTEVLPGCLKNSSPADVRLPQGIQVTPDMAASVSFSSAAIASSMLSASTSPLSSLSSLSDQKPSARTSLADLFKSRLRQRQRETEEARLSAEMTACDRSNNNSGPSQDLRHEGEMVMEECTAKETNNNNSSDNNNSIKYPEWSGHGATCDDEALDAHIAMDSDFVPDMAQYAPAAGTPSASSTSSSQPVSSPQSIQGSDDRRCGYFTCSGLKPSPVTGRLHCLCSASWRGMYGMEASYMTDYY